MKQTRLSSHSSSKQFRRNAVAFGVALAIASSAYANPNGMSVVAGQATAQTIGNLMQITNTPGAILNWQQFNIDVGQTTQFIQQNAASQVFNRVTGGDVSQILGTLQSNGQVFLINPAGVFFGQGAVVDTAGFLASTLAASNTDLLNGHLKFSDSSGTAGGIVNQGSLTTHSGGSIVLLAPSIENSGIIHAEGEVLLAAGHSVTIVDMNHPTIGLTVAAKAGEKAVNLGQIISKNASLFSHLVNNSGVVEATGAQVGEGGVIRFIAQGDALIGGQVLAENNSGQGGQIDITGDRVAVLDGARISADGATGGGTVHIGGGWQGQDATLANSQQTIVQANAAISANAIQNGDGGEVVVWADGHTTVNSEIQAKGGALGGNGGRIETSGKQSLAANVAANTSAANGEAGQWLLDPANLTIVDEIPPNGFDLAQFTEGQSFFSTGDIDPSFSPTESFLRASTVVAGLESNGSVQILTTGQTAGEGNLTVAAPILAGAGLTSSQFTTLNLDLAAQGEINIDAPIGLAPGQMVFNSFNLSLDYDLAKPVYIDAPLYLGATGALNLFPFDTGAVAPVTSAGGLPLSGVNFLSGMNEGVTGPLVIPQIILFTPSSTLSQTQNLDLNFLGSNLQVGTLFANPGELTTFSNIRLGVDSVDLPAPVNAQLSYSLLSATSLTLDSGSSLAQITLPNSSASTSLETVTINGGTFNLGTGSADFGTVNLNAGTLNLNDTFAVIDNLNSAVATTFNLNGAFAQINEANLDGATNLQTSTAGFGALLAIEDLDLNGSIVSTGNGQPSSTHSIDIRALGMGSNSLIQLGQGDVLSLGRGTSFFEVPTQTLPKQEGAVISSTGGQFVAQQGARIVMNGSPTPLPEGPILSEPVEQIDTASSSFFDVATLDITGLDGAINAPVSIEVNGFGHIIQTQSSVFSPVSQLTTFIDSLNIGSAVDITVNGGGADKTLLIGGAQFSESSQFSSVDVNFEGTLNVNSGFVRLEGGVVSTTNGTLNVNGSNSLIELAGDFTSADLLAINRTNGGALSATGFWDNSAVTSLNVNTASPLLKGDILVGDDLTIAGGLLSSAGTPNALNVTPFGFLELRDTEVTTTINLAPTSALLLASQDELGAATAPVVLNDAKINMGGDAFLVVETDAQGNATLDGTATISSGTQGNLILAGRRAFEFIDPLLQPPLIPDVMNFTVGPNIRLNVTGNAPSLPEALSFYYSQLGITNIPSRPVFLVGQLTPEAVAINEYENFLSPATTVLTGFANDSFIIDGFADFSTENSAICSTIDFCVKFDVAQNLTYSGMVMTTLGAPNPTLANSGVEFVAGADLSSLQFAVQTPDTIQFMQGLNVVTATDLASGKTLVNGANSVVRLGSNLGNETITNNLQNDGLLELQGFYTLSGLLGGTGTISNTGTLVLSNGTGSLVTNSILNNGTITNTGSYSLTNLSSGSAGSFFNAGSLNFNPGVYLFGLNGYMQTAGTTTVMPGTTLVGDVNINGGALRGFANIDGNLNAQGGRIVPGASPGLTTVSGDLNLDSASVIDIEIQSDGGVQGVDFDCIVVQGTANLAGQLNLIDISGGTLATGSEYAFLEASAINGSFASVNASSASLTYNFAAPELSTASQIPQLITRTVAATSTPLVTTTTGSTDSTVSQNLNQAFVPTNTTTTTQPASTTTTTQQEQEAVEVANQSTGGATVSQQSSSIELQSTPSDPQRASAVCK